MADDNILKNILIFNDDEDMRLLLLTYLKKMFSGVTLHEYDPLAKGAPYDDFDWSQYDVLIPRLLFVHSWRNWGLIFSVPTVKTRISLRPSC